MEVKVNIHTIQYNEYGEKNDIKVEATGTLYEKNDNTYVVYKEKENEENIYLNNGIDETAENSDSVNEEVQYVDIISLGNLIIHQSQIDGAKA